MSYKPADSTDVSPYLVVKGAAATMQFLKNVFGAVELRTVSSEAGSIIHAEVRVGDSVVMLADEAPPDWPAVAAHVHVYVPDVDVTYRRAVDAGATPVQEPVKKQDDDKRGGFRDAGGTTWWIATRLESSLP